MDKVCLYPASGEEGAVFGRMLLLELSDAGFEVLENASAIPSDCYGAVIDADAKDSVVRIESARKKEVPCFLYGTLSNEEITNQGLDFDRYFPRPFSPDEMIVALRHTPMDTGAELVLGNRVGQASFRGENLGLAAKEYRLLKLLYEAQGKVMSREEIYRAVWEGEEGTGNSNVVDACVYSLRKKLDERFGRRLICAVRAKGYRLQLSGKERSE